MDFPFAGLQVCGAVSFCSPYCLWLPCCNKDPWAFVFPVVLSPELVWAAVQGVPLFSFSALESEPVLSLSLTGSSTWAATNSLRHVIVGTMPYRRKTPHGCLLVKAAPCHLHMAVSFLAFLSTPEADSLFSSFLQTSRSILVFLCDDICGSSVSAFLLYL